MNEIDSARAQVEASDGLGPALRAVWWAFELISLTANGYAGQDTDWVLTWMALIAPACEGRDAIGFAPSVPSGEAITIDLAELTGAAEKRAAYALRNLAAICVAKLSGPATGNVAADATAAARALVAAEEILRILQETG
jgi:hypothetical protein